MNKIKKGTPGYLDYKKKVEIIRTIIYFAIVAVIFILGYIQTGTRLNLLTVIAVLGCLPSSKALVGVITRLPYRSLDRMKVDEIRSKTTHLTVCFDMIITSRDSIMPVDCIVISGHNIFGYTGNQKVDLNTLSSHIKKTLSDNGCGDLSVRILNEYKPFLTRAEGLDNIASVEKEDTKSIEKHVKDLILTLSM